MKTPMDYLDDAQAALTRAQEALSDAETALRDDGLGDLADEAQDAAEEARTLLDTVERLPEACQAAYDDPGPALRRAAGGSFLDHEAPWFVDE